MASDSIKLPTLENKAVLRILHLEDSESDRELVQHALASEGLACEYIHASTHEEFAAALAKGGFDLILSDFTLPGYDGSRALALVQQNRPDVPYIFVSGTIGEQQAIDSLKNGATDYVLKDDLDRLAPAVRRALREAGEREKRQAVEAALRTAEARYRSIFEQAVEGIYQSTPEGRPLAVNRTMARLCGYASPEEFTAAVQDLAAQLHVDGGRRAEFARLLRVQGEVLGFESQIKRRDGSVIWISENARAVRDAEGKLLYFEGMMADITARRTAEEALRQSEERFRAMAESIDHVFWISSESGCRLLYVSPAFAAIWGRSVEELLERPDVWLEAVVPEDRQAVADAHARAAGEEYRIEYRLQRADGSVRWIEDRGYPMREAAGEQRRAVGVATDFTPRRHLEAQLQHAQKMEAVGQLAGGVAHDFNNLLTVISGYSRLLLDGGTLPSDAVEPITQIYTAGARAANLTRQLLLFSRKQTADRQVFDLNLVVSEIAKMLSRLIGEHIGLKLMLAPGTCPINADAGMMEQIIMNLAVNARDAMAGGGTLVVETELVTIVDGATRRHPSARAGEFVLLTVRDTGCGIPPENFSRIFEPFFTTKEMGQGTGLGLATVFSIVQQHAGWIEVESTVGTGTCFRVLIPAAKEESLAPARRTGKAPAINGGTETMLLVEDDATVREFAVAVLRGHGYRVLQAASGIDALEVWKWHKTRIALLFSDLVMPEGLGGVDLAAILRAEKPTLKVVLTSGYANDTSGAEFKPPPATHFIHKPYKPQLLAQTVRDALDARFN